MIERSERRVTARRLRRSARISISLAVAIVLPSVASACAPDPPDTIASALDEIVPIVVDLQREAREFNGGQVYEFVADTSGYVSVPSDIPSGEVMVTLTYTGSFPAPHSLVFAGFNLEQPVTAVDLPGSNNGTVQIPETSTIEFFDGAPGNRSLGFEGTVKIAGVSSRPATVSTEVVASWVTTGLAFVSQPDHIVPAGEPIILELKVPDGFPHSVAFEAVRGDEPLVAVDGPGVNERTITLPQGTYIFYCAVPGHREAGMEGLVTAD